MVQQERKKQTIALCMIVKNEAGVITRALDSVKGFVDYYCICDTGSTDGTQLIIKDYLWDNALSGEVHERPWVDFAHNRQEAFDLGSGRCDYIMTLDADEVFAPFQDKQAILTQRVDKLPTLSADRIDTYTSYASILYTRTQFFKDGRNWKWYWPVHEICSADDQESIELLSDACVVPSPDGSRARESNRYLRDAYIYEQWLLDHPEDARAWFYLSQSYRDGRRLDRAIEPLYKVLEYTQWAEERYMTHLRLARYKREGGASFEEVLHHYWDAYNSKPDRREAVYDMFVYYKETHPHLATVLRETLKLIPYPENDKLFVERDIYTKE